MDIITFTSLSISIVSIVIVIVLVFLLRKQVTSRYHKDDGGVIEVSAIVSEFSRRLKRLEENLVDQKVKLEIMELRMQRFAAAGLTEVSRNYETFDAREKNVIRMAPENLNRPEEPMSPPVVGMQKSGVDKRPGSTEREALRLVFEGRGKITARDIQQRIGRTREHTARMMNSLFQEGLVERDITSRPFSYSITQKGRDLLNS